MLRQNANSACHLCQFVFYSFFFISLGYRQFSTSLKCYISMFQDSWFYWCCRVKTNKNNLKLISGKESVVHCFRLEIVWHMISSVHFFVGLGGGAGQGVREMFPFFNNRNQSCVFVSSAVMKEQPPCSECVAGQIVAGSRTCILTWAVAAFFIIHVEPI